MRSSVKNVIHILQGFQFREPPRSLKNDYISLHKEFNQNDCFNSIDDLGFSANLQQDDPIKLINDDTIFDEEVDGMYYAR